MMLVDFQDFKCVLAQCFQWYQTFDKTVKEITETEQNKNVFDDHQSDKFETGVKNERNMFSTASKSSFTGGFKGFDTGAMQPDAAMLREFGLPVPMSMNGDFSVRLGGTTGNETDLFCESPGLRGRSPGSINRNDAVMTEDIRQMQQRI